MVEVADVQIDSHVLFGLEGKHGHVFELELVHCGWIVLCSSLDDIFRLEKLRRSQEEVFPYLDFVGRFVAGAVELFHFDGPFEQEFWSRRGYSSSASACSGCR